MKKLILALLLVLIGCPSLLFAQEISFTTDVVQANGEATPTLTWDTTPLADDCIASGDWSGSKGGFGTETLPTITSSATYNLTCMWVDGLATLSWTAPTQNEDGSALTDLAGYKIYYGTTSGNYPLVDTIDDPGLTTYMVSGLTTGMWYFVATAFNELNIESVFSNEAQKAITASEVMEAIGITINPIPNSPTDLTVS